MDHNFTEPQLTSEQCVALFDTRWWEVATDSQIASFQVNQRFVCCDFTAYCQSINKFMGRPTLTHEVYTQSMMDAINKGITPVKFETLTDLELPFKYIPPTPALS